MRQWYKELFENYGRKYDAECFAQGTLGECDFIESEAGLQKNIRILDIGCGTGRHSIELARRGYQVTGVDLSDSMLARAKEKAKAQNVTVDFYQKDARELSFNNEFDMVIMLCEGAFPLMETDEMNFQILKNAAKALKKKGKFIFTTLSGLFPLFHSVKDFQTQSVIEGNATYSESTFNLMTFRDHGITSFEDDSGDSKELITNERYYVPSEITWLLKSLKFTTIEIYGATLGAFSRNDKLTDKNFEMLVIAEK
jgi:2-polyprenyl-3-methyl-5-hydroxy-6-metoxy-1,4-benzoquinol methylase